MNTFDVAALTQRVEVLEKQNARFKKMALTGFICAAALFVMGQRSPRIIEAEKIVLKDAGGKPRVRLIANNRPEIAFLDDSEKPYITIAGGPEPVLGLTQPGDELQRQVTLMASKTLFGVAVYGPYRSACSKVGCVSAGMSLINNSPAFSLYDDAGEEVANMQWSKDLGAQVMLGGVAAKQRAVLGVDTAGSSLTLTDSKGFQSVLGDNSLENESTGETHQTSAASLIMFKDNKVIWKAP